jgi:antitoxin component of MazEF toxin-antitoxin module
MAAVRLQKFGNAVGIILPQKVLTALGAGDGYNT